MGEDRYRKKKLEIQNERSIWTYLTEQVKRILRKNIFIKLCFEIGNKVAKIKGLNIGNQFSALKVGKYEAN